MRLGGESRNDGKTAPPYSLIVGQHLEGIGVDSKRLSPRSSCEPQTQFQGCLLRPFELRRRHRRRFGLASKIYCRYWEYPRYFLLRSLLFGSMCTPLGSRREGSRTAPSARLISSRSRCASAPRCFSAPDCSDFWPCQSPRALARISSMSQSLPMLRRIHLSRCYRSGARSFAGFRNDDRRASK